MSDPGVAVVIEDDPDVRHLMDAVLRQSGFEVYSVEEGREGVKAARGNDPTIVTLDVGLPDMDGYEVLRQIRQFSNCYIIMITALRDEIDMLTALNSGADDYLTKPFRPRELRARITAMLRRPRPQMEQSPPAAAQATGQADGAAVLKCNGITLFPQIRSATVEGREVNLTRSEFDLLHELLLHAGTVRTKADLVRAVRGEYYGEDTYISEADERAVDVHIGNLRRKLGEDVKQPRRLLTVRGVGYRVVPGARM
ncbi:response regulator transcription factor [Arthrobacter sp. H14]|uniref:response regulator transcription factor n=1 Tax=Arthrobacter sp. H14 TaxID=1312959 RepID=UPI00047EEC97|nr:response regulator transcription factor [Arthrobacter sp. H14]